MEQWRGMDLLITITEATQVTTMGSTITRSKRHVKSTLITAKDYLKRSVKDQPMKEKTRQSKNTHTKQILANGTVSIA